MTTRAAEYGVPRIQEPPRQQRLKRRAQTFLAREESGEGIACGIARAGSESRLDKPVRAEGDATTGNWVTFRHSRVLQGAEESIRE